MKKIVILAIIVAAGCALYHLFTKNESATFNFDQYNSLKRSDNSFYLLIEKNGCSDCNELNNSLPVDKSIHRVDLNNEKMMESWSQFISEQEIKHVPSLFLVTNNGVEKLEGEGNANVLLMNYQKQNKESR
ncbi:hypothetical protein JZO78_11920 [Enterococcus ureilyticus]|uniref:hypothetical protein n=1 Tax=Enterococcus ureilyticus TaxID=1131292 RepID=UPI001A92A8B4|nr:hypothetical protein [Enterococcus ureilyticus]MBO0447049.1 hypothetical protein [Enterococcus ureilyticus]